MRVPYIANLAPGPFSRALALARRQPHHGYNDGGHYTEQFAASMAISELLLQGVGDVIRVFPAWPSDRDAVFRDLRAQGGFLVSARCKDGKTVAVDITSTVGGRLQLLSPWPEIRACRGDSGKPLTLKPDQRGVVQVDTQPGERLRFQLQP